MQFSTGHADVQFSASRVDVRFSAGSADVQFSVGRDDVQFNASRADLQFSAGCAKVSSVEICSIRLWKFATVISARHGLNCKLALGTLKCCLVAFLLLNKMYHTQVS